MLKWFSLDDIYRFTRPSRCILHFIALTEWNAALARSLVIRPVGRRRVRFVFTPELLPHLMMTHCTRLQMHSGRRLSRTSLRPSVTLQRRSLKLVLGPPSLPAGIYDVLNQGGPQMHLPCLLHLCGTD